ncbi:coiled-coil domain-containing protein 78 isoform X2 [Stigmatopora argus]
MHSQESCLTLNEAKDQDPGEPHQNRSEHLSIKVDYLENKVSHLSTTNTDLSNRLVRSEEEKLKISKELVEEKLQINELKNKFEEEMFELKNKLLNQKDEITELVTVRDKLVSELQSVETHLKSEQEEHASLKRNYLTLAEAHYKELAQSKELSAELLASAQAQDTLRGQLAKKDEKAQESSTDLQGELNRVRALIGRLLQNRVKKQDFAVLSQEHKEIEKTLLGNQEEMKHMLEELKSSYEQEQKNLKEKIGEMGKEQQIPNRLQKPSELSMQCWCCQSQLKEAKEESSRLQLQVKELHQQYRANLLCYLKDITYVDSVGGGKALVQRSKLTSFVDNLLGDVRASYKAREEQLGNAARVYKKKVQKTTKIHHALICTYRSQREQILAKPDIGIEPGPPDYHFNLFDTSREELGEIQQLGPKVAQEMVAGAKTSIHSINQEISQPEQIFQESWSVIRKQLKEIMDSTLEVYEKERTLGMTRARVAEAQVSKLQDYIDKHLHRYKQEIAHLRHLCKKEAAGTQNNH